MKLILLFLLLAVFSPVFAGGSKPFHPFWFSYEQKLAYNPDYNIERLQLNLYHGSLPEFPLWQRTAFSLSTEQQFAKVIEQTNALLNKQQRPFSFDAAINQYQDNIRTEDGQTYLSFKRYHGGYGWGVCSSNSYQTFLSVFEHVAKRLTMSNELLKKWLDIRFAIYQHCGSDKIAQVKVDEALLSKDDSFVYLAGAIAFYQKRYLKAAKLFKSIAENDSTWLGQTAHYLVARSYLNQSQLYWSGYSHDKDLITQSHVTLARDWFNRYIEKYTNGLYIQSVERLIRKSYWLQHDLVNYQQQLKRELVAIADAIIASDGFTAADASELTGFIDEYHRKIFKASAAIAVLVSLVDDARYQKRQDHPFYHFLVRLQSFLKAQNAYHQGHYQQAIDILNGINKPSDSQQILKAKSLAKLAQYQQSNEIFDSLKQFSAKQIQPQIANNLMTQGGLETLLNSDYQLNDSIYQLNLARACSVQIVEQVLPKVKQLQRKYWVIYDLASRYLYAGDIDSLHQLLSRYSDKQLGDLALIKTAARMVATKEDSAKGYMNIGYFMENTMRRPIMYKEFLDRAKLSKPDCQQSYLRPKSQDPYRYYKKALTQVTSPSSLEAKILHFLVYCHKPQDMSKACRWHNRYQIYKNNPSKQWFKTIT